MVFAHIPLRIVYPEWGSGTKDGAEALSYLKRFGSVTVLNGHIHQVVQKVEGNVSFHTATSTAFPQPSPGNAPSAGPMIVPAGKLKSVLGVTEVKYIGKRGPLAIIDSSLEEILGTKFAGCDRHCTGWSLNQLRTPVGSAWSEPVIGPTSYSPLAV